MKELFEVAAGSIIGRDHVRIGINNQDAYYGDYTDDALIAVVCDGCGSGVHSEVGAKIGARLVVETIQSSLVERPFKADEAIAFPPKQFWEQIRQEVLKQMQTIAISMDSNGEVFESIIHNYLLFTIVGVSISPVGATLFSIGDGIIIVNGEVKQLGPFPGNAPPYLAYDLLDSSISQSTSKCKFQIHQQLYSDKIQSILIGTDGVLDLIKSADSPLSGNADKVGAIAQFWQEDRYFKNSDRVRRQLSLINREVTKPDWLNRQIVKAGGLLPDDTTLMVIRRRKRF